MERSRRLKKKEYEYLSKKYCSRVVVSVGGGGGVVVLVVVVVVCTNVLQSSTSK